MRIARAKGRQGALAVVVGAGVVLFLALLALVVEGGHLHERRSFLHAACEVAVCSALRAAPQPGVEPLARVEQVVAAVGEANGLGKDALRVESHKADAAGRVVRLVVFGRLRVPRLLPYGLRKDTDLAARAEAAVSEGRVRLVRLGAE